MASAPVTPPPPESDPRTCVHQIGPDSLECEVCGNTILTVHHEHR